MPKTQKEKEPDMEIVVNTKPTTSTFAQRWYEDHAVNNGAELKIICDMTNRSAEEQFRMYLEKGNTEVYAVVFYVIFMTVLEFIKEKQKKYSNFTIAIANSVNLGYTNNEDDNNEKVGNFMPVMEYIGINRIVVDPSMDVTPEKCAENSIKWKELNIKKNVEYYKAMQETAFNRLKKEYKVGLRTSECVFPIFCTFLDHITNVLKIKYQEAIGTDVSEVSMNVLGLFDVFYSFNEEENLEIIEYQPNILMKLSLKSDTTANRE